MGSRYVLIYPALSSRRAAGLFSLIHREPQRFKRQPTD